MATPDRELARMTAAANAATSKTPAVTTPVATVSPIYTPSFQANFGVGEALLNDPLYGPELRAIKAAYDAKNFALADDLLAKSNWNRLDADAQSRYLTKVENSGLYRERLKSWKIGIKQKLAARGLKADDATLDKYYIDGIDDLTIIDDLTGGITAKTAAGQAADALSKLRTVARANGFDLDRDFGLQVNSWLQRIGRGESVDDFARLIRQQAKLGLPTKVQTLLDEGLDLANIYAPYRNVMASMLEVTPDSISLDDSLLRSAYSPGYSEVTAKPGMGGVSRGEYSSNEMSIYDFKKAVRRDPRWATTDNARQEVSGTALNLLRNLGFQG